MRSWRGSWCFSTAQCRREERRRVPQGIAHGQDTGRGQSVIALVAKHGFEQRRFLADLARTTSTFRGYWYEPVLRTPNRHDDAARQAEVPKPADRRTRLRHHQANGAMVQDVTARELRFRPRAQKRLDRLRLFSVATRQYLRRRAWRYFRRLGKHDPERYVAAVSRALVRYTDDDVADGLALIDNWGLIHVLFHRSPVLVARPAGWVPAEGRTLAELSPAPIYRTALGAIAAGDRRLADRGALPARAAMGHPDGAPA